MMDTNSSIEGYLFCIAPVRQGGGGNQLIQTFCVLSGRQFSQWRHKGDLVPLRSGVLDLDHHVEDTGRQIVDTKILYTIRLYSIMDLTKEVLMGAESPEEIAEWFKAFTCSLGKPLEIRPDTWPTSASIQIGCFTEPLWGGSSPTGMDVESPLIQRQKTRSYNSLVTIGPETPLLSKDFSSGGTADLQSVSPGVVPKWSLVRCENGLRFFEETSDFLFRYKLPVTKAVGVVKAPADQIFNLIMDYGLERHQWDHTFRSASIVETIDGHSDVLYLCLRQDWIWRRPRDFCLSRYWKREDNGTYSVFYRSVSKMPLQPGYVRAYIRSGGYIVTPLKSGASGKPRTLVEFVLEVNVAGWSSLFGIGLCTYPVHLRNSLLSVVAGIREYVAAQRVKSSLTIVRRHSMEYMGNHMQQGNSNTGETFVVSIPFLDNEELDEFHDANMDQLSEWSEVLSKYQNTSPAGCIMRTSSCPQHGIFDMPYFSGSVPRGPLDGGQHCFSEPEGSNFLVKGSNFFHTGSRVAAGEPLCKLVAVDWLKGKDRMDHVAEHPHSLVQKASFNGELFFFVINLQVSYTLNYSLVFYFVTNEEILEGSLLHQFIFGDDTFRNSRLSLIPAIPEGSWIIKQAVGSRAVPLGQILDASYHVGFNYIEIDLNLGSSGVVRGVMGLVFGYISALVVDMAFFIRCDVEEELPERLIGVGRLARLQMDKAVPPLAGI
ncbi:unnamed protein product [Sphagnum troendelagicum]|uniref:START domain-containing protein n=1 Tax=Sphagnum troendelagicum TaxID=128251 RepID=A0ABP0UAG2_9BRYO